MRKGWPDPAGENGRRDAADGYGDDGKDNAERAGNQGPDEEFLLPGHLLPADAGRDGGIETGNIVGKKGRIPLFLLLERSPAPGATEEAIFDLGLARRAFLHGYPSPAIRTHHAREKKKAGPRPASWLLSLTS